MSDASALPARDGASLAAPRGAMPVWLPLLIVVLAWAAQAGVCRNGWVWDDAIVVRDDPQVSAGVRSLPRLLTSTWGGEERDVGLYRPMVSATLAVEASFHGTKSPFGFHLTNLFLHGLAAVLLLRVLSRAMPDRPLVAGTAAALFAAHPLHTGTVSWIVARGDLLVVVFGALAALAWVRGKALDATAVALAGLAWFAALLSKEAALPLPLVFLVLDLAVRREGLRATVARRWPAYLALVLPLVAWGVLRTHALGGFDARSENALLADRSVLERFFVGCGALVRTGVRLFVPAVMSGDGRHDPVLVAGADLPLGYALAAGFVCLATAAVVIRAARGRAGALDAAWGLFVALSVPVLQIVPLGAVFEDRFAYVPSTALLVVGGLAASAIARRLPPVAAAAAGAVVLGLACSASWAVAADWRDDAAFYRSLLREEPDHVRAMTGLARTLLNSARDARRELQATPVGPETQARRDTLLARWTADSREAVAILERARTLPNGRSPDVFRYLGDGYLALPEAQYMAAVTAYQGVIERKRVRMGGKRVPQASVKAAEVRQVSRRDRREMAEIYANRGAARRGLNDSELAIKSYEASVQWDPDQFDVQHVLGSMLMVDRRPSDALPHLQAAVDLAPPDRLDQARRDLDDCVKTIRDRSQALFEEALTAEGRGDRERALARYQDAIEIRRNHAEAWVRAGRLMATYRGNLREARTFLERAIAILDAERARTGRPEDEATLAIRRSAQDGLREVDRLRETSDDKGDAPAPK